MSVRSCQSLIDDFNLYDLELEYIFRLINHTNSRNIRGDGSLDVN